MTVKDIKSAVLKKGWAGKTISRKETAQRLNPLIEEHVKLKHAYFNLLPHLEVDREEHELQHVLEILRLDVGKLKELVFSCGETAFNGTSLEPESFTLANNEPVADLYAREHALSELLSAEHPIEHQIRTEAVLTRLRKNSVIRLNFIRACARNRKAAS